MPMIPRFTRTGQLDEFREIFEERFSDQLALMEVVKDKLLGKIEWRDLDAKMIEVIEDLTKTACYDSEWEFKKIHPEYESSEDDLFIPRRSFQENVKEALKEALKEQGEAQD